MISDLRNGLKFGKMGKKFEFLNLKFQNFDYRGTIMYVAILMQCSLEFICRHFLFCVLRVEIIL